MKRSSKHTRKTDTRPRLHITLEPLEMRCLLSGTAGSDITGPLYENASQTVIASPSDGGTQAQTMLAGSASWGLPAWSFRKKVTIDGSKVTGSLTDFPLQVTLTDASLGAHSRSDGADIVFTAGDGTTVLPSEIESYNSTTGALIAWVKVPQLSAGTATTIYLYFANPAATSSSQNPRGTWDSSYLAVHHLEELSGAVTDSTAVANNGTALNGVARNVAGEVAKGYRFDGIDDRITLPQVYSGSSRFTIEGWVNTTAKQGYIFCQYSTANKGVMLQYYPVSNQFQLFLNSTKLVVNASANAWHHIAATYDGTTARLYLDGVLAASAAATVTWPAQATMIGDRPTLGRAFRGTLDELRLSNTARSAAYIATEYSNAKNAGTFMTFQEEQGNVAPTITMTSPTDNSSLPVPPTELVFNISDPRGEAINYTVTTSPGIGSASATGVPGGQITVPLSNVQGNTTYTVLVQADDGVNFVTKTYSFTVGIKWGIVECMYRQDITIDHTKVPFDTTNFPVCVDVTDPGLIGHIQAYGADVIFTGADGVTPLDHEVESFDATTGHLVAWVNVPQLSTTQDTNFFMYYGNSDPEVQSTANPPAVWGSQFLAVLHMSNPEGKLQDSTINGLDGEPRNGVLQGVEGRIGPAVQEDGVDDGIEMTQVYKGTSAFSVEAWVNGGNAAGYIFSQRDTLNHGAVLQFYGPSRQIQFLVDAAKIVFPVALGQWYHVVGTFDGTTARLYVNGVLVGEAAATVTWPDSDTWIGDSYRFDRTVLGKIDEVRLFNHAVDASYVSLSYATQNGPASITTVGERQRSSSSLAFSDVYPATHSTDVELNPTLAATITDLDGLPFDYHVDLLTAAGWVTLASGTGVTGPFHVSVPTTGITAYEKAYVWRIVATADQTSEQLFDFTTRKAANYSPMILDVSPADTATAIPLGTMLQARLKDLDGNFMNVTFSIYDSVAKKWVVLKTYTGVGNGVLTADATAYVKRPYYDYTWKISAIDPAGTNVAREQIFTFRTGGALETKFSVKLDLEGTGETQLMPVMGDIDNDGDQEIVLTCGDSLYSINGKTGQIEWQIKGEGRESAPELADLDNDGVPEVLYGLNGCRIRAVRGDGTIMWTTKHLVGNDQSLFPLLTCDINGDGYPEIYFCTEDTNPSPYSGDMSDYTGALNMVDHNGNLLRSTWLYHPCWGGAAIGDVNGDGKFEIFVSDRRYGYDNMPAHGLAAYDAATLTMLWSRPDIHHSSPIPILADYDGDGKLEVIAERIVGMGPMILNAMTGATIKDYSNKGLPTHGVGTLADLDSDGHLELIMASSYPMTTACDFCVFDLTTGKVEFRPTFAYHASWAPRIGDVTGDGVPEILAAMGDQGSTSNFPLLIYDNKYNLIDRVDVGAGQLGVPKLFDCDGDGLNEIVVAGAAGKLVVIDTPAPAPAIPVRSGVQMYGESRNSNPVYQPAPGPQAPILSQFSPGDHATGVDFPPTLSANVFDWQAERLKVTFEVATLTGTTWTWQTVQTLTNQWRGTISASTKDMHLTPGVTYRWRVTASDILNNTTVSPVMEFTTAAPITWQLPAFEYRHKIVIDHNKVAGPLTDFATLVDVTLPDLAANAQPNGNDVRFVDATGQALSFEIESYDAATGHLKAWVRMPSISNTQDTTFYLYFGNPTAASGQDSAGTWANYLAVHHLEEGSGLVTDSTSNGNNATALNGVTQGQAGMIGNGYTFDGIDDRLQLPRVLTNQTGFTLEGWVNPAAKQGYIFSERDTSSHGVLLQYYAGTSQFQFLLDGAKLTVSSLPNQWHYVCATFDGTTATLSVDGGTPVSAPATVTWPTSVMTIGDQPTGGRGFRGLMDELRISPLARNDAYRMTVWNSIANAAAFSSVKAMESQGSPQILPQSPANGATNVPLNLAGLAFDLNDHENDLMNVTASVAPGAVGGLTLTQVGNGHYVIPVSNLLPETTYTWTVNVTDGTHTTSRQYTFTTTQAAPQISAMTPANGATVSSDLAQLSFDLLDNQNDPMDVTVTVGPGDVGGLTLTKAGNGHYVVPLHSLLPDVTYTWTVTATDGVNTTVKQSTFTTVKAAPQILALTPATGATVPSDLAQLSFDLLDNQNDLMDVTVTAGPGNVGGLTLSHVSNGHYTVPLTNLQPDVTYTWTVTATDGVHTTIQQCTFTTVQAAPQIMALAPADGATVPSDLAQLSFDLLDMQNDQMTVTVTAGPGNVGGLTLTKVGNGHYVVPLHNLLPETVYTWTVTASDGVHTTVKQCTFSTSQAAPQILALAPGDGAAVSPHLAQLSFDLQDNQNDLMDVTVTTGPGNVGGVTLTKVGNGHYVVPLNNLQQDTTYTWTVTASDGVHVTTKQCTFTTGHDAPRIQALTPADGAAVPWGVTQLSFDLQDDQNDLMDVTVTAGPGDVGGVTLTQVGNGHYVVPLTNLQQDTTYTWTVTVTEGAYTTTKQCTFTTAHAAPRILALTPADGAVVPSDLPQLSFDLLDDQNDLMDVTVSAGPGTVGGLTLTKVGNGHYVVPLTNLQPDVTYTWTVTATDGVYTTTQQCTFSTAQAAPQILALAPADASTVPSDLAQLSFDLLDAQNDLMDVTVTAGPGNVGALTLTQVGNGHYVVPLANLQPDVTYTWNVTVTDGTHTTVKQCTFTTAPVAPQISAVAPADGAAVQPDLAQLSFDLLDAQNDLMDVTVTTGPDNVGSLTLTQVSNGHYVVPLTNLQADTYYTWTITATDGTNTTTKQLTFTTAKLAPQISGLTPSDASTVPSDQAQLSFDLLDAQNDFMDVTVTVGPGTVGGRTFTHVGNGHYVVPLNNLLANTTYTWTVTATDGVHTTVQHCTFTTVAAAPVPWHLSDFEFRHRIVVDYTKAVGTQNDYAALVDVTLADLAANAQANGNDIRFVTPTGQSLSFEIESYDASTGHLKAWVRLPSISDQQNTIFYLYFGNPTAASGQDSTGTWVNYLAVHHLEETSGLVTDSTANGTNATALNGVTQGQAGYIANGYTFDGVDDRLQLPRVFTNQTAFTLEGWVNSGNAQGYVFFQRDTMKRGVLVQYYPASREFEFLLDNAKVAVKATMNAWHYICATFDGTTATLSVDGGPAESAPATVTWPSSTMVIGDQNTGGRAFLGQLDELRISPMARSDSYRMTMWNNIHGAATFCTVKPLERQGTPEIQPVTPANGATNVSNALANLSFNVVDHENDLMNVTVTVGPGDVGSLTLTQVGNGTYVVPLTNLLAETTYTWTVTASDGTHTAVRQYTFSTAQAAPQILAMTPANTATVPADLAQLSFDLLDAQNDLMDVTVTVGPGSVGGLTLTQVGNGHYVVPLTNLQPQTAYTWTVTASDGTHTTSLTNTFTTDQASPPQTLMVAYNDENAAPSEDPWPLESIFDHIDTVLETV